MGKRISIDMKPVAKSTNVAATGYDPETQTLAVEFKSGGVYHYAGVSQEHADALAGAESVGAHFAANIRGQFDHKKIEPEPEPKEGE